MSDQFHVVLATDWDPRVPGYRKRKVFPKTKSGCSTCKSKKVKCDEKRPVCARCLRNGRLCEYTQSHLVQSKQLIVGPRVGTKCHIEALSPSLFAPNTISPFPLLNAKNGTPMLELLQDCQSRWRDILHVEFTDVFKYMFQSSHLIRNVVLGITACNLRHLSTNNLRHQIAEHFYESLAVQEYLNRLSAPVSKMSESEFNELILGGMLLNILCFPLPRNEMNGADRITSDDSWESISTDTLGWLALQAGLRPLLKSGGQYLQGAMEVLGPIFLGANESRHIAMSQGLRGVPDTWIDFFDMDTTSDTPNKCAPGYQSAECKVVASNVPMSEVLGAPMMLVAFLRQVEPVPTNSFHHFAFLAKAHPQFRELLFRQDEKATWLYGYWCGLMCRFEGLWWSRDRSRRDYEAVCRWLQKLNPATRPGSEGALWRDMLDELEFAPTW